MHPDDSLVSPDERHDLEPLSGHVEIISWLEVEIKRRLLWMNEKLDLVAADVGVCANILHKNQNQKLKKQRASIPMGDRSLASDFGKQSIVNVDKPSISLSETSTLGHEIGLLKAPANNAQIDLHSSNGTALESVNSQDTKASMPSTLIQPPLPPIVPRRTRGTDMIGDSMCTHVTAWGECDTRKTTYSVTNRNSVSVANRGIIRSPGRRAIKSNTKSLKIDDLEVIPLGAASGFGRYRELIWRFLDDVESSRAAALNAGAMRAFLVFAFVLSLVGAIPDREDDAFFFKALVAALEIVVDIVCITELALRFFVCPNKWNFLTNIYTWIDFFAAYPPLIMRAAVGWTLPEEESPAKVILVCVVPVLRLFKMLRHFEEFHLLLNAFYLAFEALPVLLYMLLMITLIASAGMYTSEPRSNIASLPEAIWLSVVTMSTVGYGDVYPITTGGKLCVVILIIVSVLYMAIPLGIIGGAFQHVWIDRDRILLMQRTRDRLNKWGYTPENIQTLFHMADLDGTGELDIDEFCDLIKNMKIGLSEERIAMLFEHFDEDRNGFISSREFIRNIFPNHFLAIHTCERLASETEGQYLRSIYVPS